MRIGIDVSQVVYGTGVSTYTRNLVTNLLKIDKENEYILFGFSLRRKRELYSFFNTLKGSNFKERVFPLPPTACDLLWNRLHLVLIERIIGKVNVFHSSDWFQPPSKAFKVTTIHDLVPLKFPELSHPKIVSTHNARLKRVKEEVDIAIVPSQTTSRDLADFGFDANKIRVIPEAPDPSFKPASLDACRKIRGKYQIEGKFLLAVGINPRKNTEKVIEAFEILKKEANLKLVIIGEQISLKIPKRQNVRLVGYVSEAEKPAFYSAAEVLVYPSLYEGFGLPILEAFACKTPVVTSNIGSLKEVAGEAAVLVNPRSIDSIVDGIEKSLKSSENYIKKGVKRVKKFSWEKAAKDTLKIYSEGRNT